MMIMYSRGHSRAIRHGSHSEDVTKITGVLSSRSSWSSTSSWSLHFRFVLPFLYDAFTLSLPCWHFVLSLYLVKMIWLPSWLFTCDVFEIMKFVLAVSKMISTGSPRFPHEGHKCSVKLHPKLHNLFSWPFLYNAYTFILPCHCLLGVSCTLCLLSLCHLKIF